MVKAKSVRATTAGSKRLVPLLIWLGLALAIGASAAADTTPCLLVSGVSFVPVILLPQGLQAKVTEHTPVVEIEGLRLVPVRHLAVSNGAQLTWHSETRTMDFRWQGREIELHALSNLTFWREAAIVALTSFRPQTTTTGCVSAVDGDTIKVSSGETVRYIGVDTPETKHPTKPVQYFGPEASAFNTRLVAGRQIALEYDVGRRDRYGRLLAYVHVGDAFVNADLVAGGYAQVLTYPPNVRYQQLFSYLQQQAREAGKGLWGQASSDENTASHPRGKYVGSVHSNIYHRPECKWAARISEANAVWFDSAAEARAAGYRPCRACKPPQ